MLEEPIPVGKHTQHSDAVERALRHATLTCLGRARVVRAPGFCQGAVEAGPGSRASCRAGLARIWALIDCKLGMPRTTLASYFRGFLAGGSTPDSTALASPS